MKIPSTPTATDVLAIHGISSRRPPLATPPPSSYMREQINLVPLQTPIICTLSIACLISFFLHYYFFFFSEWQHEHADNFLK